MFSKISLNSPSYFFMMVFYVERNMGYFLINAYLKQEWAKLVMESLVLYMDMATPGPLNSYTG